MPKQLPRVPGEPFYTDEGYDRELAKLSVGPGWASLIDEAFDKLEELGKPTIIVQVKEKYAGLRIYISGYELDSEHPVSQFERFLQDIERRSLQTCEQCGEPGEIRGTNTLYTACDLHANKTVLKS